MDRQAGIESVLGLVILVLRRLCGWTQEELGERAGISGGSISFYEQGEVVPDREKVQKIAEATGVTLVDIDRLAGEILRASEKRAPAARLLGQADLAAAITDELAEGFRARAFPEVRSFLSARRAIAQRPAPEEARRRARDLWECLEAIGTARLPSLAAAEPDLLSWAVCELLAERSAEAASDDADRALELADLALWVAERVPSEADRPRCVAYAFAFLGNARRVRGDLRGAEGALDRALRLWREEAAGDPGFLDGSRLLGLQASLRIGQRRLAEARGLLAEAAAQAAPGLPLGRILIKDAYAQELLGDYDGAVETLRRADPLIPETEVRLRWVLQFNGMKNLCHLGQAAEAERMLPALRALAARINYKLDGVRMRWLAAKIDAGVGRAREAVEALSWVRARFAADKIRYDEALVSLELAGLYLEQGRTADVKRLVLQMEPVFRDKGVHEEARKALDLFRRAVKMETATPELAGRVAGYLRRAQHDPELIFEEAA